MKVFLLGSILAWLCIFLSSGLASLVDAAYSRSFSTYIGGINQDSIRDTTIDSQGNIYITGGTASADFPTTAGVYSRTFNPGTCPAGSLGSGGAMDIYVAKFSPMGQLIWSTFVGGPCYDRAYAIEVDAQENVYIGGRAGAGFPTTAGVVQPVFGGDTAQNALYGKQDGFIAKLRPDGSGIIWSTYIGDTTLGFFRDIDIDAAGNVYGAMAAVKGTLPHITAGAYDSTHNGQEDAAIVKLSPDGTRVLFATYIGGAGMDGAGPAIRVGPGQSIYMSMATASVGLPSVIQPFKGGHDLYVAKLSQNGQFIWGNYLGGTGNEDSETHGLAVDSQGNAYITGVTFSNDFPTTASAFDKTFNGQYDIPLAKISSDGQQLLASTYIGGSGGEDGQGITVDKQDNVIVFGGTNSPNFPVTADAFQSQFGGGVFDYMIAKFPPSLASPLYVTYIGGSAGDDGRSGWVGPNGEIAIGGMTLSTNFPLQSAYQTTSKGDYDGALVRFAFSNTGVSITPLLSPTFPPTTSPTVPPTSPTGGISPSIVIDCLKKRQGDADCDGSIALPDFEIWRKEFFAGCNEWELDKCGPNDDQTGITMDADFNNIPEIIYQHSRGVALPDFEIWRSGYFASQQ